VNENLQLIRLRVNNVVHEIAVEPRRTLVDVLRHDLGLTGTHVGCEHGVCGACTVLLADQPIRSCLMFAVQADDLDVRTVESLAGAAQLSDLQQAFMRNHGLQCGFCTPGFLMLAEGFLSQNMHPTREDVRDVVAANLCRCTGYQTIIDAIAECAQQRAARSSEGTT
jgi:aerobic-type carbon monoxide dehydrogenase small subunit (CoxS/CutS family)